MNQKISTPMVATPWLNELISQMPGLKVTNDRSDLNAYGRDWTKVYEPNPALVCFPNTTKQVSELLEFASQHKIAVVPSGGRTGLAGGAVAMNGEIVLALNDLNFISDIDPLALTVRVGAGAVTEAVHHHAAKMGLTWPIDFASKGSSTVGGNIATNAGGVKVIRYGLTRNWVLGLTVVLMDGRILNLNGSLEKNNTGVDLRQVFIGTEGILGVITEATLKLCALPKESDVYLFALKGLPEVFDLFHAVRTSRFCVNAFECLSHECLDLVLKNLSLNAPFANSHPQYVLLEIEKPSSAIAVAEQEAWLQGLLETACVEDAVLAQSPKEAQNLWSMREGISESLANEGLLHKHDISLPIHRLQDFILNWGREIDQNYPEIRPYIFGHIGDGNLHINLLKPKSMEVSAFRKICQDADQKMFHWIQKYEGSVSAEHGIGLLKKHLLPYTRTADEIELMKQMKRVFDPAGLLNPGKIF